MTPTTPTLRQQLRALARLERRGVVGVLAMMFLVMFASLAGAMAIATQGNLRSAASYLRVVRAHGAVDTGLVLAQSRLENAVRRFYVAKGEIDPDYLDTLWFGPIPGEPDVRVIPPLYGTPEAEAPRSIQAAIANRHAADSPDNIITGPDPDNAPAPIVVYDRGDDWLVTDPIGIDSRNGIIYSAVQISYGPPNNQGEIPVVVTGYDWDYARQRWVTRTAEVQYRVAKRVEYAIISNVPSIIGVGGNVDGPIGSSFNSTDMDPTDTALDGSPAATLSDFYGLEASLDNKLDDFYNAVATYDVDGDNRLRENHATESIGLAQLNIEDYDGDSAPDNAFTDSTRDDVVDDFDIFLKHYDTDRNGRVVLSASLTAGTPAAGASPEFTRNDAIGLLVDSAVPDRNANGWANGRFVGGSWIYTTFRDNNADGVIDSDDVDEDDVKLGYRDGVIDYRDQYAKIRGGIYLRASRASWEAATINDSPVGSYQEFVQGPIRTGDGQQAVTFDATEDELPTITGESFDAAGQTLRDLQTNASPLDFWSQVYAEKGGGWTPPTRIEGTPFGAASPADYYERPVFENITFRNVTIPMGTNALFINCTFIGITRVEAYTLNTHPSWTFYGQQERSPSGQLVLKYPPPPDESAVALDQSYADPSAEGYDQLPSPLTVSVDLNGDGLVGDTCYDTKLLANNIRFHDCTIVGSVIADRTADYTHVRNKLQFTGETTYTQEHPEHPHDPDLNPDEDHVEEIAKSSMLAPQWSVDIGSLNPPPSQDVQLRGAIIAGVLDVRGNAEVNGVVIATFEPVRGQAPLVHYGEAVGNPANFNNTIGYATSQDGDLEAIDTSGLADLDGDGQVDLGWDSALDENGDPVLRGYAEQEWMYDGVPDEIADPALHWRRAIPYSGVGVTKLIADPDMILPDGLALPLSVTPVAGSYKEGI
ncbi:MAG: hypothetical protein Tsb0013_12560 [Phycisphaerales bacterium]